MDRGWWHEYGAEVDGDFELWTTSREAARIYTLNHIHGEGGGGLPRNAGSIRLGGNSGFQAVSLALHFGARRVTLLGYDMQIPATGRTHWHGDHSHKLGNPMQQRMSAWHRHFADLAGLVKVPIVNATRETALKCFPRLELAEALEL